MPSVTFIPAFQVSAASGSEDLRTQDAKAMQTRHMSACFSVEKTPSRPVRDMDMQKSGIHLILFFFFNLFHATMCKIALAYSLSV